MVLNEWLQGGVLRHAFRHVPGIQFPAVSGEKQASVLRLVSLVGDKQEEMPEDVIAASGLVAVQFFEDKIETTEEGRIRLRRKLKALLAQAIRPASRPSWEVEAVPAFRMMAPAPGDGLVVFREEKVEALTAESGLDSLPIGPTILLQVKTDPEVHMKVISKFLIAQQNNDKTKIDESLIHSWQSVSSYSYPPKVLEPSN
jgi:hypothetical protein